MKAGHGFVPAAVIGAVGMALALSAGEAGAQAKVTVTPEEARPSSLEIKAGEEVVWVNASGGTAHVWFGLAAPLGFYVGPGGVTVKFDRPGTYEYAVHLTLGTKGHTHPGRVVVK